MGRSRVQGYHQEFVPRLGLVPLHLHREDADVLYDSVHLGAIKPVVREFLVLNLVLAFGRFVVLHAEDASFDEVEEVILVLGFAFAQIVVSDQL